MPRDCACLCIASVRHRTKRAGRLPYWTMATRPDPLKNHLLAALPADEWARWLPALEPVAMPLGEVLYESGAAMTHVYFPTTSIVSLLYVMEDGASAEIAVVGNEGL